MKVKTSRGLIKYIFFSIITLGIYPLFFIHSLAKDMNTMCNGDGQKTRGLIAYWFFSLITLGIYSLVWNYNVANRISENAHKYDIVISENGTTWLLWTILGAFICIGPLVAFHIICKNANRLGKAYNATLKAEA